jgi:hypothetical protein
MKKSTIALLIPAVAAIVIIAGCGKKVTINTQNGNVTADIDASTNSANININGSTLQTGDSVKLPSDWPSDVYVIDGTVKAAWSTPNVSYSASLETTKSLNEAKTLYESKLSTDGWTTTMNGSVDTNSAAVIATKGTKSVQVSISNSDGPTVVILTVVLDNGTNTNTVTSE